MNGALRRAMGVLLGAALSLGALPSVGVVQAQPAPDGRRAEPTREGARPARARARGRAREARGDTKKQARAERRARRAEQRRTRAARARGAVPGSTTETAPAATPRTPSAPEEAATGVAAEIVKEGDTSVKVMTFTGLDIEGRLRSPQLVYFTQRVRAEFDRPVLPHRSFVPEIGQTTAREPVR